MTKRCVIVGAGHAAAQLSVSLRQEGWDGDILVIGDEPYLPYHRPPLSKTFLKGDKSVDDLAIRPPSFYEKHDIVFRQARVEKIDRSAYSLVLDSGDHLSYDKLALCMGGRAREISLPGSELEGIYYLRNIRDAEAIKSQLGQAKKVVIVGGGYVGLETAALMVSLGMEVDILEAAPRVLQRVVAPDLSAFYLRVHQEEGVNIHLNADVQAFCGDTLVEKVTCANGQEFMADLVIVGIGLIANTELSEDAGLKVNNGIVVDASCVTSDPDIVASGDCTNHYNKLYDCRMRLESVPNANEQAKVAAASICGHEKSYQSLPWFWSDQYGMKLQIAGMNQGHDQVLIRGDSLKGRSFSAFYFKDKRLISADCVNRPQEFMLSKRIISQNLECDPARLVDESIPVKELLVD